MSVEIKCKGYLDTQDLLELYFFLNTVLISFLYFVLVSTQHILPWEIFHKNGDER